MKFYSLVFSFVLSFFSGQTITDPNFSIKTSPYEVINFENSKHSIYYKVSFSDNPLSKESKREAICILQIGDRVSKFLDFNQLKKDSLAEKYSHQSTIGAKETNEFFKISVLWNNVIFKNNGITTVQDRFKSVYQYEENSPKLNWNLAQGNKEILGYQCKKAIVRYRGREYTAWYTVDIPINKGPYVFEGLPGLIMEIEDKDQKYHFVVVGIGKKPLPIYLRNEKNIFKTTREKFRNVEKTYKENPAAFFTGKAYNEDGTPIVFRQQNMRYEPMELD